MCKRLQYIALLAECVLCVLIISHQTNPTLHVCNSYICIHCFAACTIYMVHTPTRGNSPLGCNRSTACLVGVSKNFLIRLLFALGMDSAGSSSYLRLEPPGVLELLPSSSSLLWGTSYRYATCLRFTMTCSMSSVVFRSFNSFSIVLKQGLQV